MRRVIASVATTLDGYLEGPGGEGDLGWLMPHVEDSLADNAAMLAGETDTIVLGRRTYEGFSQYWPGQEGAAGSSIRPLRAMASPGVRSQTCRCSPS